MGNTARQAGAGADSSRSYSIAGPLLIALGVVANHWLIGKLFSGDGSIDWIGYRIPVWILQACLIWVGLLLYRSDPRQMRRAVVQVTLVIAAFVFSIGLSEIYLRLFVSGPLFHPNLPFYPHRKLTMYPKLPGVSDKVTVTTNQWGLRGDPIGHDWEERTTILAVGGSTTKGSFLPDSKTWPAQLQELLRAEAPEISVQNAGLSGHTTRGHLLLVERLALRIKPDMAIFLVGVNDLQLSLDRATVEQGERSPGMMYTLFASSRALQSLYTWYRVLVDKVPTEERVQNESEGTQDVLELKPLTRETPLPPDLTDVLPSLGLFERNIKSMIAMARSSNIAPMFLTQPLLYGDSEVWATIQGESFWFSNQELSVSAATYWRMLEVFNRRLLDICQQESVPCFDLGAEIPKDQAHFYDSMHFTEKGAELVAQKVAAYMIEQGLIPQNRH